MTLPAFNKVSAKDVEMFHRLSDVDRRIEAQHHTLGLRSYQSSAGNHTHDGTSSLSLLNAVITGSRSTAANSILNQLLNELTKIGLVNGTSA